MNEQGTVLVQDLAGVFAASEATIRADLRFLEQKGVVTRFHGGAAKIMSGNSETETQEVGFKEQLTKRIGRHSSPSIQRFQRQRQN